MNFARFVLQNHTQVLELTLEHLWLVGFSTVLAVLVGVPLGIVISHCSGLRQPVLASANIIQTIPVLRCSDFCYPYLGWANVLIVWQSWRLPSMLYCRLSAIPMPEFETLIRRLWKQDEGWA